MGDGGDRLTIIGLTGEAEAGKDGVAKFLDAYHGFQQVALADGIREALNSLDGRTWAYRKERGIHGMTDRTAMQVMGTECRENAGCPDVWLDLFAVKILYASKYHPVLHARFAVPDVRHPREARYLRAAIAGLGGVYETWRVVRPGHGRIAESSHSSEAGVASVPADRTIVNGGTRADLGAEVLRCLGEMGQPGSRGFPGPNLDIRVPSNLAH